MFTGSRCLCEILFILSIIETGGTGIMQKVLACEFSIYFGFEPTAVAVHDDTCY